MSTRTHLAALAVFTLAACGAPEKTPTVEEWRGTKTHLEILGTVNGEALDIKVDEAGAADAKLACKREYEVPLGTNSEPDWAAAKLVEVKLNALLTVGEETRLMEIELKRIDLQSKSDGAEVVIIPRVETQEPTDSQMWFEWEWHTSDKATVLLESAAQDGAFKLGEFTGTPGEGGVVIPDSTGTVGGHLTAQWSETDEVTLSFSATCGKNTVTQL